MDSNPAVVAVFIGVALLILVGVAVLARRATVRALVWWVGLACLPIGALLAGMDPYLIDAWNRLAAWWQAVTVSPIPAGILAGLVIVGIGLALMLISRVIPYRRRKPVAKTASGTRATRGRPVYDATPASQTTPTEVTP
jgi:hypothetical protein